MVIKDYLLTYLLMTFCCSRLTSFVTSNLLIFNSSRFSRSVESASNRLISKGVILTGPVSVWFGLVRKRSDFDSSGSVNRKRVYGSVCDKSEPSS